MDVMTVGVTRLGVTQFETMEWGIELSDRCIIIADNGVSVDGIAMYNSLGIINGLEIDTPTGKYASDITGSGVVKLVKVEDELGNILHG